MKKLSKRKCIFIFWTCSIILWFVGCPNTNHVKDSKNTSSDKIVTVENTSFTMKLIKEVKNKKIGSNEQMDNKPHTVNLSSYYIAETEVTQELWSAIMANNPSRFRGGASSGEHQEKRPVEQVSWFDCIAFCNGLSLYTGLKQTECVYRNKNDNSIYTKAHAKERKEPVMDMNKKGFRLPTEAEWEWAAMGNTENLWSGTNIEYKLKNYAWFDGTPSNSRTHEVAKKEKNEYGLYDMSGNVWEWCWDWELKRDGIPLLGSKQSKFIFI